MAVKQLNILFVFSDQHAADVLRCAGDKNAHTPNLDWLAATGVRFTNAYCNSPVCVPSRQSMLTGKTPSQLQVWNLSDTIRSDELTWPTVLGAAGYDTVISGHLHTWWPDKQFGFHQRLCGDKSTRVCSEIHEFYEPGPRREQVMENFKKHFLKEFTPGRTGQGYNVHYEGDKEATTRGVEFIRQRGQKPMVPWALYVGLFCPHSPLVFPKEYYDRYRDMPVDLEALDSTLPPALQTFAKTTGFDKGIDPETAKLAIRAYYAMVHFVDEQVGRLIEALRDSGQLDNTVIVYAADHGEMLGHRGLWYKNQLLERSIRIPFLIRYPNGRQGVVENQLVSLLDLFPTYADLAGADAWPEAAGQSLCPLLTGVPTGGYTDRPVFVEYADYGIGQPAATIRKGHLKLLAARTYEPVLYDLERDPDEKVDRSKDPAYATAVAELQQDLGRYWNADEVYRLTIRNQKRIDLLRRSRLSAIARGETLFGSITA